MSGFVHLNLTERFQECNLPPAACKELHSCSVWQWNCRPSSIFPTRTTLKPALKSSLLISKRETRVSFSGTNGLRCNREKGRSGKGDGSFRIVGDFKELNDRIVRDVYHFPTPEDLWRGVKPESNLFFVCDATSSYNQIRNSDATMKMMAVALPTTEGTK